MSASHVGGLGRLVCLEGIDGAGKTTAVAALGELLRAQGVPVAVLDKNNCRFTSAYVDGHMAKLRALIWDHPAGDPYLELGDMHWVHLQVAWYLAMTRCAVQPLLETGTLVLTDTWTHKFLAKLAMRPAIDLAQVRSLFGGLIRPDLVIRLDIDPELAASRKEVIAVSEAGNTEETIELTRDSFVAYQRRLAAVLDDFALADGWVSLDVTDKTVPAVAESLAAILRRYIDIPSAVPRIAAEVPS
jgi:thymidylate kinase